MSKKEYLLYSARTGRNCAVRFLNSKTGKYMPAISLGTSNKKEAEKIIIDWLKNGIPKKGHLAVIEKLDYVLSVIKSEDFTQNSAELVLSILKERGFIRGDVQIKDNKTPLFKDYVSHFWDFKTSPYVKRQKATGKIIGPAHCKNMLLSAKKHALSLLGDMRLSEISVDMVNNILFDCQEKGLSSGTINNIAQSICQPLKFAYNNKIIETNIERGLFKFSGNKKERGILTHKEASEIFKIKWSCKRSFVANLLASQTGMRIGEIIALRKEDIGIDRLFVRHSYSEISGLKSTKTGKERILPLMPEMRELLLELAEDKNNPGRNSDNPYIFYSLLPKIPFDKDVINRNLHKALEDIGISSEERKERNIVFHSWRHYVATYLANNVKKRTGMSITGHKNEKTFDGYADHESDSDFAEKMEALKGLLNIEPCTNEKPKINFS